MVAGQRGRNGIHKSYTQVGIQQRRVQTSAFHEGSASNVLPTEPNPPCSSDRIKATGG